MTKTVNRLICRLVNYLAVIALALVGLAPFAPATAADFVMKFGTATLNESQHQFIKFYKEALEKASGDRIKVEVYPASQLGPIPRMIDGLQLGTIEAYAGPADFYVGVDPRFGVFSAPMLFRNNDHASATVLEQIPVNFTHSQHA
jgi:TRAP-type C4-dicarboxylate transport system substrate-binding protein